MIRLIPAIQTCQNRSAVHVFFTKPLPLPLRFENATLAPLRPYPLSTLPFPFGCLHFARFLRRRLQEDVNRLQDLCLVADGGWAWHWNQERHGTRRFLAKGHETDLFSQKGMTDLFSLSPGTTCRSVTGCKNLKMLHWSGSHGGSTTPLMKKSLRPRSQTIDLPHHLRLSARPARPTCSLSWKKP